MNISIPLKQESFMDTVVLANCFSLLVFLGSKEADNQLLL